MADSRTQIQNKINKLIKSKGRDVVKAASKAIKDSGVEKDILTEYQASIRKGINPKTSVNYKPLAKSTKDRREYLEKFNVTHSAYKSSFANNTFTGQLIDALKIRYLANVFLFKIFIKGNHKPYSGAKKKQGKTIKNELIAEYLSDMGRDMLGAGEKIKKMVKDKISKVLNSRFR